MLKTKEGDLVVTGQLYEPKKVNDILDGNYSAKADTGKGITAGKNAWREVLK